MRKRNIKKQIWLDAKEAGLTEAEFIRSLIKGYRIKAQPTEEIKKFQRELYGIANNINQIARIANTKYNVLEKVKFGEKLYLIINKKESADLIKVCTLDIIELALYQ